MSKSKFNQRTINKQTGNGKYGIASQAMLKTRSRIRKANRICEKQITNFLIPLMLQCCSPWGCSPPVLMIGKFDEVHL